MTEPLRTPTQSRALKTVEALLSATQEILAEVGYDGVTSNAVAARAGLTPPAFYRYFKDKHMLLATLGQRLLDAQNALIDEHMRDAEGQLLHSLQATQEMMHAEVALTKSFVGGCELMFLMRALPELSHLRLQAHEEVTDLLSTEAAAHYTALAPRVIRARTRLATELYYSTVEMLFETNFRNQKEVIRRSAIALHAALGLEEGL